MRASELLFTLRRAHAQLNAPGALLLNLLRRRCGQDRDPILAKNLRYCVLTSSSSLISKRGLC
jgi:hypothetical protein